MVSFGGALLARAPARLELQLSEIEQDLVRGVQMLPGGS
jgi:hypothetical protein